MSSFVLSLLSPVLRKMVCGNFKEGLSKGISLEDIEEMRFSKLIQLACGEAGLVTESVDDLFEIGVISERLQMERVRDYTEDVLLQELHEANCVQLFARSEVAGLEHLRKGCYKMLRNDFEAVSQKEGFEGLSKETMASLLDSDDLGVVWEESALEALVHWMKKSGKGLQEEWLLKKIRYGVMHDAYLAGSVLLVLPEHAMLQRLVAEALVKKGGPGRDREGIWDGVERLCDKWNAARKMPFPKVNISAGAILGASVLKKPRYVAVDLKGNILVSDMELHQVMIFGCDGSIARCLGSKGTGAGQFDQPMGLAVDKQGHIVVADRHNHRIQVLNLEGLVVNCFGCKGTALGQLNEPHAVSIDSKGRIAVTGRNLISVFSADGSFLRCCGSEGATIGQIKNPMGVSVDREVILSNIYIYVLALELAR